MWLKYERFRNLIIQTIYSTPGVAKPTTELTDDNLVTIWKKMIDEKLKMEEKIDGFKDQMKNNDSQTKDIVESLMQFNSKLMITEVITEFLRLSFFVLLILKNYLTKFRRF
jgi:hypothetical protein